MIETWHISIHAMQHLNAAPYTCTAQNFYQPTHIITDVSLANTVSS